jgi:hypothetical protein
MSHWTKKVSWQPSASLKSQHQSSHTLLRELESLSYQQRSFSDLSSLNEDSHSSTLREIDLEGKDDLTLEDYLTSGEVLDFMKNYLPGKTQVRTEEFLSCLELDYPDFMQIEGFREELADRLTVDPHYISLNRLQTLTQEAGLTGALTSLADALKRSKEEEKADVNSVIVSEMTELSNLLALKSKELAEREAAFEAKLRAFQLGERQLSSRMQAQLERMGDEALQSVKTQALAEVRKLQSLERTINEHFRALRTKAQIAEKTKLEVPKSQGELRLKARVQALEKTNEHLKAKCAALDGELDSHKAQVQRLSEELGKIKAKNMHLEQVIQDLKVQKARAPEPEPIPIAQPIIVPAEPAPASVEISLLVSLLTVLLTTLRDTLPVLTDQRVGLGALLYPSFNALVPKLIETLPLLSKGDGGEVAVSLLHALVVSVFAEKCKPESRLQYPTLLDFQPTTDQWRKKISIKPKSDLQGSPLYPLFSSKIVQGAVVALLAKHKPAHFPLQLQISVLTLLLGTGNKVTQALRTIKTQVSESKERLKVCEYLLADPARNLQALIALTDSPEQDIASLSCQVMLLVSMYASFAQHAGSLSYQVSARQPLLEAMGRALEGSQAELEECLAVLLQKLVAGRQVTVARSSPLVASLAKRVRSLEGSADPEARFLADNLSSILQHSVMPQHSPIH